MSESPPNNHTGSNSHCNDNSGSFLAPPSPVQSPDPLLFLPDRESSPTLTLLNDFRLPESQPEPPRVEPEEPETQTFTESEETPPRRLTNLDYCKYQLPTSDIIIQHLNIFGDAPVTSE
ncbi:hypothetical protein Bca4012_084946 [Brassica carinata]